MCSREMAQKIVDILNGDPSCYKDTCRNAAKRPPISKEHVAKLLRARHPNSKRAAAIASQLDAINAILEGGK